MQNTFKSLKIKFRTLNWQLPPNRGVYNTENKFKNLCVCCWQSKLTAMQRAWACIYGPQTKISEGAHVSFDAHNDSAKDAVPHGSSSLRTATQFLISNDETDSFKKKYCSTLCFLWLRRSSQKEKSYSFTLLFSHLFLWVSIRIPKGLILNPILTSFSSSNNLEIIASNLIYF